MMFYLAGIVLARYFGFYGCLPFAGGLLVGISLKVFFRGRISFRKERWITLGFWLLFVGVGGANYLLRAPAEGGQLMEAFNCRKVVVAAKITHEVKESPFGRSARVEVFACKKDSVWFPVPGGIQVFVKPADSTGFGRFDTVLARGYLTTAYSGNPGYLTYLNQQGVFYSLYVDKIVSVGRENSWYSYLEALRQEIGKELVRVIDDSVNQGVALAMFLGDKSGMDKKVRKAFTAAGLSHILAISGLHVGIVFVVLSFLLSPLHLFMHGARLKNLIILILLAGYMLITGASPSVVRASLMFSLILLFRILSLRYNIFNIVATAGLLQVLYEPEIVFDIGFQLSYSAVLGILVFLPIMESFLHSEGMFFRLIFGWISVTICASLATLPLIIYHFGQFPAYFLLSNILASTLSFALVLSGFFTVIFSWLPWVSDGLGGISNLLIGMLVWIAERVSELPDAVIDTFGIGERGLWWVLLQLATAVAILALPRFWRKDKGRPIAETA